LKAAARIRVAAAKIRHGGKGEWRALCTPWPVPGDAVYHRAQRKGAVGFPSCWRSVLAAMRAAAGKIRQTGTGE